MSPAGKVMIGLTCLAAGIVFVLVSDDLQASFEHADDFPVVELAFDELSLTAAVADTEKRQAIGYRNIQEIMAPDAVYFPFWKPTTPVFHMRGVKFPITIHWVNEYRCVTGSRLAFPGEGGIIPPAPVMGVLEVKGLSSTIRKLDCFTIPETSEQEGEQEES